MPGLWTPDGETDGDEGAEGAAGRAEEAAALDQELAAIRNTPAAYIVGNHAIQLFELARVYLTAQPPALVDAQLAIDAMAAVVEGLTGRLGEDEPTLVEGLAAIRLAYVQLAAAVEAGPATA